MFTSLPRHRYGDPSPADLETLFTEGWHVSRSWPGTDPAIERDCPCPKGPCGWAYPTAGVFCDQHLGQKPIRQHHRAKSCKTRRRSLFGRKN